MSESDPLPASEKAPAPPLEIRKRWWRIIYIGGCFGPVFFVSFIGALLEASLRAGGISDFFGSLIAFPIVGALLCALLPLGLAVEVFCVLLLPPSLIFTGQEGYPNFAGPLYGCLAVLSVACAYWIFAQHWRLTLEATSQREFRLLMLSLILLVCGSLITFFHILSGPFGLQH